MDLSKCYEELRREVLMPGQCSNQRRGYGVFVHRGMRAWMEVCSNFYPERRFETPRVSRGRTGNIGDILPSSLQVEMAHILTGIVFEHMRYAV